MTTLVNPEKVYRTYPNGVRVVRHVSAAGSYKGYKIEYFDKQTGSWMFASGELWDYLNNARAKARQISVQRAGQ